jgi:maltodextrin utilization protein YvdJ
MKFVKIEIVLPAQGRGSNMMASIYIELNLQQIACIGILPIQTQQMNFLTKQYELVSIEPAKEHYTVFLNCQALPCFFIHESQYKIIQDALLSNELTEIYDKGL